MPWLDRVFRATMRSGLLWGAIATVAFYIALDMCEPWAPPFVVRCLTSRWAAYVCTSMFFVGAASLAIKAVDLVQQLILQHRTLLQAPVSADSVSAVQACLKQLDAQPRIWQGTCLVRRFRAALAFLQKGSGQPLDEHLRYLADMDGARMNASYGLPRFLSWAIPAVGSLGTVLGIAAAVTHLSLQTQTDSLTGVAEGLAIAFDTMALSLALSIVLVLFKFICEQQEQQLLISIEQRVERELPSAGSLAMPKTSQVEQLRKLTESVIAATDKMAQQQTGLSNDSLKRTSETWSDQSAAMADQLETIVSRAVANAVAGSAVGGSAPIASSEQLSGLSQVQEALQQIAEFFARQNAEQAREREVFMQLAESVYHSSSSLAAPHSRPSRAAKPDGDSLAGLWGSTAD